MKGLRSARSRLSRLSRRRADACALGFIALFFALFFGWLLLPDGLWPVTGDSYFYALPLRAEGWRMIRAGQPPVWTPHVMAGYPLLSMAQLAFAYPLTWGHAFLPPYVAETVYVLAPFLLAPAFTYFYARQTGRTRAASLLAALAYGWGGGIANGLAHSGMLTNALVWLPLLLFAIERARTRPFAGCLLGATAAYTLCVLNGHAQGFVYVGALAAAYAAFLVLFPPHDDDGDARPARDEADSLARAGDSRRARHDAPPELARHDAPSHRTAGALARFDFDRVRPLAVCACALAFGAGLCAFQILETMRAARRSVRSIISYETFAEGSFPPAHVFESMALPLFSRSDVSAYVAPVALAFALAGAWLALRGRARRGDTRPVFWACAAVVSFLLMIGNATPLYRIVYYLPVINRFRVPARHSFELTFAVAALAAYGLDLLAARLAARRESRQARLRPQTSDALSQTPNVLSQTTNATSQTQSASAQTRNATAQAQRARAQSWRVAAAVASVVVCASVGFFWHRAALAGPSSPDGWSALTERQFAVWKVSFSLLTLAATWLCLGAPTGPRRRALLLACALGVAFFFEPFICYSLWWRYVRKPAARFDAPAAATQLLRARAPDEGRAYTRVGLFADETIVPARVDAPDLAALRGLREVAGYEPLALVRYSRALADNYADVNPARPDPPPDSLFGPRSRVLDLLGAAYVVTLPAETDDQLVKLFARDVRAPRPSPPPIQTTTRDAHPRDDAQPHDDQGAGSSSPDRWEAVYDAEGLLVARNRRACPRAWLVAEAESVDGEQALRRIRGGGPVFDPRRTALLEDAPAELPPLPGGDVAAGSAVRVLTYEPSRIVFETDAPTPTVLVVSEMMYPGWEATVDGRAERIHLADFLLRAVPLPAGAHRVEMRYRAPQARNGLLVSAATLLLLAGLTVFARRRSKVGAK